MVGEALQPDAASAGARTNGAPSNGAPTAGGPIGSIRLLEGDALDPLVQPQCSLSVQLRRQTGSIVGRTVELTAIAQVVRDATKHLTAVTLEGEPGIGKTS